MVYIMSDKIPVTNVDKMKKEVTKDIEVNYMGHCGVSG